jgi:thiosulfate/3-mercaptopyruvate sulfurtransferase
MPFTTLIQPDELKRRLGSSDWVVLDCRFSLNDPDRGLQDYVASHIPGAQYAHLDEDLSGEIIPGQTGRHPLPPADALASLLGAWGIDAGVQVVAYDDMGGPFAARLWWLARWLGHQAVAVLDGGWPRWLEEGLPTTTLATTPSSPRTFVPHPQDQMVATASDVERIVRDRSALLVDARAVERYEGAHEPIDPVAGHIPTAVNYPWMDNLQPFKTFQPADALRERFDGLANDPRPKVCYWGSGVTGAHNVLAMTHAGLPDTRLYAGSWSDWILDPSHAIETGRD